MLSYLNLPPPLSPSFSPPSAALPLNGLAPAEWQDFMWMGRVLKLTLPFAPLFWLVGTRKCPPIAEDPMVGVAYPFSVAHSIEHLKWMNGYVGDHMENWSISIRPLSIYIRRKFFLRMYLVSVNIHTDKLFLPYVYSHIDLDAVYILSG